MKLSPRLFVALAVAAALAGCFGRGRSRASAELALAPTGRTGGSPGAPVTEDNLVIEGWITLGVDDVAEAARSVSIEARARGGKVVAEDASGGGSRPRASVLVHLPPQEVDAFVTWVERLGSVTSRRLSSTDVTKQIHETDIALENLEVTLGRLRDLTGRPGIGLPELLELEKEMGRVRGEIERLRGEKRRTADRVALASIEVTLHGETTPWLGRARPKLYPGPRFATLFLLAPDEADGVRLGGGATLYFSRGFTFDLDFFQGPGAEPVTAFATIGGAIYSDYLGRGRRTVLNPYLGARAGYGYFLRSRFLLAGEVGVELIKLRHVLVEANVRIVGLLSAEPRAAIVAGAGFVIAF